MCHPGQVPRFKEGYSKSWDASRDPEQTEIKGIANIVFLSWIPDLISLQDEIRPE